MPDRIIVKNRKGNLYRLQPSSHTYRNGGSRRVRYKNAWKIHVEILEELYFQREHRSRATPERDGLELETRKRRVKNVHMQIGSNCFVRRTTRSLSGYIRWGVNLVLKK